MFHLVFILICAQSVFSQKTSNSTDFKSLNREICENKNAWVEVEYGNSGINTFHDSLIGLRAKNVSCESIPVFLEPGSLEVYVYLANVSQNSGVDVTVYLKNNELIANYTCRGKENLEQGWRTIVLDIKMGGVGFINLIGYSEDNDTVLVDSVFYTRIDTDRLTNEDNPEFSTEKSRGKVNEETDRLRNVNDNLRDSNDRRLGPWLITFIVVACVSFTGLVIIASYHLGKLVGEARLPPIFIEDDIPPVRIIPRVKGTVNYFENTIQNYV